MVILNGVSVGEVESFIELGLQKTIIANTQNYGVSDIPGMQQQIAALPKGGLTMNQNYGVPAEQLIAAKPDLVVSPYAGGFDSKSGFATREELAKLGIRTIVTPANCANGNPEATAAEKQFYNKAGVTTSFDFLNLLGRIFDVPDKAASVVSGEKATLARVAKAVAPDKDVRGLIAGPGATPDAPYVWTGGVFDDVLRRAGVTNAFAGQPREATISAEQLAKADVGILVLFVDGSVDAPSAAARIFAEHPLWAASKAKRYVVVHDGMYFGPAAVDGVEKVARAAHPDAF
ncbi:ABC transporter substrate-binding protein [Streptomyces sp. NBC_00448]|uniref:ABC transporter substrate-binding protein n=1 Tax=Streptomyces sp. NBC_00448 TaxID=2903652 RepID=UPI002E237078